MNHTFEREWTSRELDSGCTMDFHPDNGWELMDGGMHFDSAAGIWYYFVHKCGWDDDPNVIRLQSVSGGKNVRSGDSYPDHWNYDPWTGKNLNTGLAFYEEIFQ